MALWLGVLLFGLIFAVALFMWIAFNESDRWIRTDDPTVRDLIERYEQLPPEKQDIIRDIADDG